jgi:hypothetical protein
MSEEKKPLNIYQRINAVRKKVDYVQKNKSVSTGSSGSYKAVTHDEITGVVRPHLIENGIVIVPSLKSSKVSATINKDGTPSNVIRYEATYEFKVVNEDDPQDFCVMEIEAHANDNQDKAPGKALSYAKKYAVLKLFEIETGEDEESRFKESDPFPVHEWIAKFDEATSMEQLAESYKTACEAVKIAGTNDDLKSVIKAKDVRKKALEAKNG